MGRIVFVNRHYDPDPSPEARWLTELAEDLALDHREVLVICSRFRTDEPGDRLPRSETIDWVQVRRVSSTRWGKERPHWFDRMTFYLFCTFRLLFTLRKDDTVIFLDDPPLLAGRLLSVVRLKGAQVVVWCQSPFPEAQLRLGHVREGLRLRGLVRRHHRALRLADAVVASSERFEDPIAVGRKTRDGLSVIPGWADGKVIHPVDPQENDVRRKLGLHHSFVIGCFGTIEQSDPIWALKLLIEHYKSSDAVRFLLVGRGGGLEKLRGWCLESDLDNVTILGEQPKGLQAATYSVPDIHLLTMNPKLEGLAVPFELYRVMAAGRPALYLGDDHGEAGRVMREFGSGYAVALDQDTAIDATVDMLRSRPKLRLAMGQRARQAFESHFDRSTATRSWSALLDELHRIRES